MDEQWLRERIEVLRKELEHVVADGAGLQDPKVMAVSTRLDKLIARYLRQELSGTQSSADGDSKYGTR